jgi:tRNA threonylcarbamoyladenosine biosynthesis protein TsaB
MTKQKTFLSHRPISFMNLLALDTSTEQLSLALSVAGKMTVSDQLVGNASSQHVLPQIQSLLTEANIKLADLDGIAFGAGPGSFTGVRIAAGVTQGLAFGASLPVVSVSTLLALAEASGVDKVITCLDARMGEVYHAAYEKEDGAWVEVMGPTVCKPEFVPAMTGHDWVGVGSGWKTYPEPLSAVYEGQLSAMQPNLMPSAKAIVTLAKPVFTRGEALPASEAMPLYVRNRVALTTAERAKVAAEK